MITYQTEPTAALRWIRRRSLVTDLTDLVLQQAYQITTYDYDGKPFDRKMEWRDVPTVDAEKASEAVTPGPLMEVR